MEKIKFSVLMSVYYKENPEYLRLSLDSVFDQTLKPTEVILVEDGKLTDELDKVIDEFLTKHKNLCIIKNEKNQGLGFSLNDGLKKCKYEYVFRMDTDDICRNDRFEIQMNYMKEHADIDVLGTNIYEFKENIEEEMRLKKMPIGDEINKYILGRNPINHMTACFKKKSVIECGGYQPMDYLEDYYLWIRMYSSGKKIENIDDTLVYARVGNGFEKRRGNKKQLQGWKKLQAYMLNNKLINKSKYKKNMANMYAMVYCPTFIRKIAYKFLLRK